MSIFSLLPNDLIMDIVKTADGGLYTHKLRFCEVMDDLECIGDMWQQVHPSMMKGVWGYGGRFMLDREWLDDLDEDGFFTPETIFSWRSQYHENGEFDLIDVMV